MSAPKATVWSHFAGLTNAAPPSLPMQNLGQGFPDSPPPAFVLSALQDTISSSPFTHQYTRSSGHPLLVSELATRYSKHLGRPIDADTDVAVTVGASQALFLSLLTLIEPGDEVVIFEPFFDLYLKQVELAGGVPVFVRLDYDRSSLSWNLDPLKLQRALSLKTRCVILNTPHNPTGKVFTPTEQQSIADAIETFPKVTVLADEVYKFIVHSPPTTAAPPSVPNTVPGHVHFASLPNMFSRTLTISSAGKTFSATGWQVGWAIGPTSLIQPLQTMLPAVQFCASSLMQEALARALPVADEPYEGHGSYYEWLNAEYTCKRDFLVTTLSKAGFKVPDYDRVAGGGFFIFAEITERAASGVPEGEEDLDWRLCEHFIRTHGVSMIPACPFFDERAVGDEGAVGDYKRAGLGWVRVAFCKQLEVIEEAGRRIAWVDVADEDCAVNLVTK